MLVGSNGSGKSTLFRLIAGLLEPQSRTIACRIAPPWCSRTPTISCCCLRCGSDLMLGMPPGQTTQHRSERMADLLAELDLAGLERRPIHALSGGQKQRLAIAGALASEAGLLLLDEPTALLDPDSQRTVLTTVQRLCHRPHQADHGAVDHPPT